MSKTIAVIGATGTQGGGVVAALLKEGSWKIRALTRNPQSDKAKTLGSQGIEVVSADSDSVESLIKAFEGVSAIYAVTNWWEHLFTSGTEAASKMDYQQGVNLAIAASKTASIEHYIWATLPSAKVTSGGKHFVPHMDSKSEVDAYIKNELPGLAKKTTFLWHGFYTSNLEFFPLTKPTLWPAAGKHIFLRPVPGSTTIPMTGNPSHNTGAFVRAILAQPSLTYGRYVAVWTDTMTIDEMLSLWSSVTGNAVVSISATFEEYSSLWPLAGEELARQMIWHVDFPDWQTGSEKLLLREELGIQESELIGAKESFGEMLA